MNAHVQAAVTHFEKGELEIAAALFLSVKREQPLNKSFQIAMKNTELRRLTENAERDEAKEYQRQKKQEMHVSTRRLLKEASRQRDRNARFFSVVDAIVTLVLAAAVIVYMIRHK
jgi:hypothetical protein